MNFFEYVNIGYTLRKKEYYDRVGIVDRALGYFKTFLEHNPTAIIVKDSYGDFCLVKITGDDNGKFWGDVSIRISFKVSVPPDGEVFLSESDKATAEDFYVESSGVIQPLIEPTEAIVADLFA